MESTSKIVLKYSVFCFPPMTLTDYRAAETFACYLMHWHEIQNVINWLFKVQTMQVWIWKTESTRMGGAVEHLLLLAGSRLTSGRDLLCLNAARLRKHFPSQLWIHMLRKLNSLLKKCFVPVKLFMLYTLALSLPAPLSQSLTFQ